MKTKLIVVCLLCSIIATAQLMPTNRYFIPKGLLDKTPVQASFAYSLRKLRNNYTGPALRIRRPDVNAQADIYFDTTGVVSDNSLVTIAVAGTGFPLGQIITLGTFRTGSFFNLRVSIWYDQSLNAYHASQTVETAQPEFFMNSAGLLYNLPVVSFTGSTSIAAHRQFLKVNRTLDLLLGSGYLGSFIVVTKTYSNRDHFSFGCTIPNWRWSVQINWSDQTAYFDAGESCCQTNRSYFNASASNFNKVYSFVRRSNAKLARLNKVNRLNEVSSPTGVAPSSYSGTDFYIGSAVNNTDDSYYGTMNEVLLFPTDMSAVQLGLIESDQIAFWGL